jgi:dsDNA-specific endonuclease/ATPase MutS2
MITIPDSIPEKIGFESVRQAAGTYIYTPGGRNLLQEMTPSADPEMVEMLGRQTSEMLKMLQEGASVPLTHLEDVDEWLGLSRTEGAVLSIEAFPCNPGTCAAGKSTA